MILPCTCEHKFQDKEHGKGMRVHNPCKYSKSDNSMTGGRCTVCSNVKAVK